MIYLVYALVFLTVVVFSITTSENHLAQTLVNYFPKEAVFVTLSSLIIGYSFLNDRSNGKYCNKIVFAFLLFISLQFFAYFYFPMMLVDEEARYVVNYWPVKPFINILVGILLIKTLVENLTYREWVNIFKFLAWFGFGVSTYALLQWCGVDPIGDNFEKNFVNDIPSRSQFMMTTLSHHTLTGAFIALTAPLNLMFSEKKYKFFLGISIICLLLVDSLLALCAFLIAFCIYLLLSKRLKTLGILVVVALVAVFFLNKVNVNFLSNNGRLALWKKSTVDVLEHKPFRGFGHGSYAKKYNSKDSHIEQVVLFAHNDYVQELNEGGLPGFVMVLFFVHGLIYKCFYNIAQRYSIVDIVVFCAFVGLCLLCGGTFVFHYPPFAVIGILYISYIEYRNLNIGRLT